MRPFAAYIFLFITTIPLAAEAQNAFPDSLFIPSESTSNSGNNKGETQKDTSTLIFPGDNKKLKKPGKKKTENFFQNFEDNTVSGKWIRELHNIIVIPPANPSKDDSITTERSIGNFIKYNGLIINEIKIVKLDVFGVNIENEANFSKSTFINRTANSLHIKTHDRVLQRHLLFKPGDKINPAILSDNERIIRELPFIEDARIMIEPVIGNDTHVNIILVTKDVWSKAFFVEFKDINYIKLELFDKNIFGTGLEIQNNFHWNPKKSGTLGYEAIYKNNNILGSFINSKFFYTNIFEKEFYGLELKRKFFTPGTKYAGGASTYYLNTIRNIWFPDSGYFDTKIKLKYFDLWFGRSFLIKSDISHKPDRLSLMLSSGIFREEYHDRPDVTATSYYRYHNKILWLNSIAFSRQSFYKSNLIYSFGRTEDIPTGCLANLVFGPEFGEFKNRFYTSFLFSRGDYIDYLGYINFKFAIGGFHTHEGKIEQAISDIHLSWFTNLIILGSYKFRFFSTIDYRNGYERFTDEKVFLNDPVGIRGFRNKEIFGTEKLILKFESVAFSPSTLLGFRFATSVFADLAFLFGENKSILSDHFYSGLGLSVRFRNERLVFPTFHLRFVYYPGFPGLKLSDMVNFLGEPRLNPEKYYPDSPAILNYN